MFIFWLRLCCLAIAVVGISELAWGEERPSWLSEENLRQRGLTIAPVYTGEVFSNVRGGISTRGATQYQALLDLGFTVDFDRTKLPVPGKLFLLAQNTHGRGLTEDFVGDTQVLSNIDSFNNIMQVSEYWWQWGLFEDDLTIRLGKQDLNSEFLYIDAAGDFIQSTFGLSPSTAFPTYPDPAMGAVAIARLTDTWTLKSGVWSAFASGGSWGFSNQSSVLVAAELERAYTIGSDRLPGILAIGAVYESAGTIDGQAVSPVHEYVFQWEQYLLREKCDPTDQQGLALFGGYYPRFPGRQIVTESVGDTFIVGAIYNGLLPRRDRDTIGVGLAWAELFAGGTQEETVVECFYKARINQHVTCQPDLQYIGSPSGIYRDALVAGFRFQLEL